MSTLVLLNQALRLRDNPLLNAGSGTLHAVVVLDKAQFFGQQYGLYRANLWRLNQQIQAILHLQQALASKQIGLILRFGNTASTLQALANELNATTLIAAEPTSPHEYAALQQLAGSITLTLLDCNSLFGAALRPDINRMPDRFTAFRKNHEPLLQVSLPVTPFIPRAEQHWSTPQQAEHYHAKWSALDDYRHASSAANPPIITETAAWQRLQQYIWQEQHILHYKETRNALQGEHYASFFSSALAMGSLSARDLWQQIVEFEQQVQANDSTYWLKFELLWREFFRWQMRKYQSRWFSQTGIKGQPNFQPPQLTATQRRKFAAWCAGQTGIPFVDANMRLLNQSGLMSNRGRQNVASYLIHDLAIDWRLGAAYFEQRLLDYECASNWGNWAYIAGYGNSEARPFNMIKQALAYDPKADFVRHMLPELTAKDKTAHRPQANTPIPAQWHNWLKELD
ncbi:DASH family cryptochrome [Alishewanella sp. HL-SH06]|uniref:DASH family cryptochrome n=1 Tax=Alishewanella sp. HL-SH06 TaxID=3461144 RepID=UPI0040415D29